MPTLDSLFAAFLSEVRARAATVAAPSAPQKIVICGSIAAGKSRLLEHLQEQGLQFKAEFEPLDSWINYRGSDVLELVYSGKLPGRVTNMIAFGTYLDQQNRLLDSSLPPDELVIAERDLTQVFVFQVLQ